MNQHPPAPLGLRVIVGLGIVFGVIGFFLSANNARLRDNDLERLSDIRNQDRIAADVRACERGNAFREDVRNGFAAIDDGINGIIDLAGPPAVIAAFRERASEPLARLRAAVEGIELTDCQKVVPGARSTS